MKRDLLIMIVTIIIVAMVPCIAFADAELDIPVDEEISEEYSYASTVSSTLTVSNNGKAKSRAVITGLPGTTTKLAVTMYLQNYSDGSWKTVKHWSASTTLNSLQLSKSKTVSKGKYRTHTVFKAYHNSGSERIVKNSKTVNY